MGLTFITREIKVLGQTVVQRSTDWGKTWWTDKLSIKTSEPMPVPILRPAQGHTTPRFGYEKVGVFCYRLGQTPGKVFGSPLKQSSKKRMNEAEHGAAILQEHAMQTLQNGGAPLRTKGWQRAHESARHREEPKRAPQAMKIVGFRAKQEGDEVAQKVEAQTGAPPNVCAGGQK